MMQLGKTAQYAVSAVLAVYVVFFTRPAPVFVVRFLSSPIAQLAVLAAIVYVGASMSLLVALVAAVALVLSIPSREYLAMPDVKEAVVEASQEEEAKAAKRKEEAKKAADEAAKKMPKKSAEPAALSSESAMMKSGSSDKGTEKFSIDSFAPF
jgi:16S rRNA A1518/A1519 N6-dimethyltransferase RsmA/KsgA/DIM1 with predicted DNA glycosylase/AP lyase activity